MPVFTVIADGSKTILPVSTLRGVPDRPLAFDDVAAHEHDLRGDVEVEGHRGDVRFADHLGVAEGSRGDQAHRRPFVRGMLLPGA